LRGVPSYFGRGRVASRGGGRMRNEWGQNLRNEGKIHRLSGGKALKMEPNITEPENIVGAFTPYALYTGSAHGRSYNIFLLGSLICKTRIQYRYNH
jgi:hypothetical protein